MFTRYSDTSFCNYLHLIKSCKVNVNPDFIANMILEKLDRNYTSTFPNINEYKYIGNLFMFTDKNFKTISLIYHLIYYNIDVNFKLTFKDKNFLFYMNYILTYLNTQSNINNENRKINRKVVIELKYIIDYLKEIGLKLDI